MGYYRKFDTISLISLNDWYVLDFPLKNYDSEGNEVIGDNSDNSTHGNTKETPPLCLVDFETLKIHQCRIGIQLIL